MSANSFFFFLSKAEIQPPPPTMTQCNFVDGADLICLHLFYHSYAWPIAVSSGLLDYKVIQVQLGSAVRD